MLGTAFSARNTRLKKTELSLMGPYSSRVDNQ